MSEKTKFFEKIPKPQTETDGVYHTEVKYQPEVIWFRPVEVSETALELLMEEIEKWEVVDTYKQVYENLVYEDRKTYSGERVIPDADIVSFLSGSYLSSQLRGGYLLEKGSFAGVILKIENTSSFGMSAHQDNEFGILLTDGRKIGRTEYHYFHCSTEIDEEEDSVYSLRRKEDAK